MEQKIGLKAGVLVGNVGCCPSDDDDAVPLGAGYRHARFLGEGVAVRSLPYPTVATSAHYPYISADNITHPPAEQSPCSWPVARCTPAR
jgi:hypothetical protein